jgi:murein DD-endopeptidase MepM/ murein hydrolase activator NlpD
MRDLARLLPKLKITLHTPKDEVLARVRETAEWSARTARNLPVTTASITGIKLAYAGSADDDPYAGARARVVPENIMLLTKTTDKTHDGSPFDEKTITAQKGDTVAGILHNLAATPDEIAAIDKVLGGYGQADGIKAGDKLRVLLSPVPNSKRLRPVRVIVVDNATVDAVAALADSGQYVSVDPTTVDNDIAENDRHTADDNVASNVTLYQSVYETALNDDIPRPIIEDMIRIYSFDVDFDRKAKPGDSFEVLYTDRSKHPSANRRNDILFAALTVDGQTKKLYRFQTPDDGVIDYYDGIGKSAKKFLLRKPVPEGVMTSGFGLRRHPLLGYVRMHTGVDWAAPIGTPIYAAGNGVIEKEGWEGGYGRFMLLHHANGYETAYGHMSAFAKGTHVGEHVRQGQVIGFIGSTGLSTGAHLHFEIRINSHFVDPMRIKLPGGRKLKGPVLASFEEERDRLDTLLANRPARVAANVPTGQ